MKHKFRSCAALLMALYMIFSLAACGQSGSTGSDTKQTGTKNNEPAPEFTYTASFTKLLENSKDDSQPQTVTADGFYSVGNEKVGDNTPEGVTPDYEGQYDVYAPYITFTDFLKATSQSRKIKATLISVTTQAATASPVSP